VAAHPPSQQFSRAIKTFYSYAHVDRELRKKLDISLAPLKRQGKIKDWYDRYIEPGAKWEEEIKTRLNDADLILLLISPDYLDSDFCYAIEGTIAWQRHNAGEARIIPIILRPSLWEDTPVGQLQALPQDVVPVTRWADMDEAFKSVAEGIRDVVDKLLATMDDVMPFSSVAGLSGPSPYIPRPSIIGFVPRVDEEGRDILEQLKAELAPGKNQLVALWGAGGVGKTTLAAEAARFLSESFAQRVVWVSAYGREDFTLSTLLDEIATQLNRADLRPLALAQKSEQVRALITAAPALCVLDNFETVKAEERARITNFLTPAPCSTLITTRQKVEAAHNIGIEALSAEEAREFLERLIAKANDANAFTGLDRERIIETAEANPLVLQWVVAQIDETQNPRNILEALAQGAGNASRRAFDVTFNLPQLGNDGQAVLLALALSVPSASRPALAQVSGFGDDLKRLNDVVRRLAALWLVRMTEGGQRLTIDGLTRELAREWLEQDARKDALRQRFVEYFVSYAEKHEAASLENFNALETEKDNLLSAMDIAFLTKNWESVMRLMTVLGRERNGLLDIRGYWSEAISRGEQATTAARMVNNEEAAAQFAVTAATFRMKRGEYDEARRIYHHAIEAFRNLKSAANVAVCLHQSATIALNQGKFAEAQRLYDEALQIRRSLADQNGTATTLFELGRLARSQNDFTSSQDFYHESLELRRLLQDESGIAGVLHELGRLEHDRGDLVEAAQFYEQSLKIKMDLRDQWGIAATDFELGRIAHARGDFAEAQRLYKESIEIRENLKDQKGLADTLNELGKLEVERGGDLAEARRLCLQSLHIRRKLGDQCGIAGCWYHLGIISEKKSQPMEAASLFRDALIIFENLRSPYAELVWQSLDKLENTFT
jgi:tetratricopeptide (TPR) repeat protein